MVGILMFCGFLSFIATISVIAITDGSLLGVMIVVAILIALIVGSSCCLFFHSKRLQLESKGKDLMQLEEGMSLKADYLELFEVKSRESEVKLSFFSFASVCAATN
ncbi:hypothetical protein Patl1_34696 [Pistacia atlantica]|uniref:Uncharacterized protein n=1 Tax=Pistacia atlantica TaxID=434234 RepID=A0ACC0ZQN2_9ROSI|nr:hypothetical protein Patl1_34696 [Pistacia atlantica]